MKQRGCTRIGLPFEQWPAADLHAWRIATSDGDILDGRGPAAHWRPDTKKTNLTHYGRWLAFLTELELSPGTTPAARITPDRVHAYIKYLQASVAPCTVASMLIGLKVMAQAMAPDLDGAWLKEICNALNRTAKPITDKDSRIRPSEDIYRAAMGELTELSALPRSDRLWCCRYRNALMLAFLVCRPLRLRNFVELELGRTLIKHGAGWMIAIPGAEVKNRQPIEFELLDEVVPFLERYLDQVRPQFRPSRSSSRLWLAWKGAGLSKRETYHCLTRTSERLLGVAINPHLLRDCAATSLSLLSPAAARAAGPLLGHRQFATTERHYVRARQLDASRMVNAVLADLTLEAE